MIYLFVSSFQDVRSSGHPPERTPFPLFSFLFSFPFSSEIIEYIQCNTTPVHISSLTVRKSKTFLTGQRIVIQLTVRRLNSATSGVFGERLPDQSRSSLVCPLDVDIYRKSAKASVCVLKLCFPHTSFYPPISTFRSGLFLSSTLRSQNSCLRDPWSRSAWSIKLKGLSYTLFLSTRPSLSCRSEACGFRPLDFIWWRI